MYIAQSIRKLEADLVDRAKGRVADVWNGATRAASFRVADDCGGGHCRAIDEALDGIARGCSDEVTSVHHGTGGFVTVVRGGGHTDVLHLVAHGRHPQAHHARGGAELSLVAEEIAVTGGHQLDVSTVGVVGDGHSDDARAEIVFQFGRIVDRKDVATAGRLRNMGHTGCDE